MFPGNVSLALKYLESSVSNGAVSNYSLCLAAYALTLAGSRAAGVTLAELKRRADYRGTFKKRKTCLWGQGGLGVTEFPQIHKDIHKS